MVRNRGRQFRCPANQYSARMAAPQAGRNTSVENLAHSARPDAIPKTAAVFRFGSFSHSVKAYIVQQNIAVSAMSVVATAECAKIVGRNVRIPAATRPVGAP